MTLQYVLRNFRRRKVRTVLMLAAAHRSASASWWRSSAVVDSYRQFFAGTVAGEVGDFDLVITRPDTAPDPFLRPDEVVPDRGRRARRGAPSAPASRARPACARATRTGDTPLVALEPETDTFGAVTITDGEYDLSPGEDGLPGVVVLQQTADTFGLKLGDPLEIQYAAPLTRLAGKAAEDSASRRRSTRHLGSARHRHPARPHRPGRQRGRGGEPGGGPGAFRAAGHGGSAHRGLRPGAVPQRRRPGGGLRGP